MAGTAVVSSPVAGAILAQAGGIQAPAEIFDQIYVVFLVLGTLVGIVVVTYALYNAYKYRDGDGAGVDADVDRPELGEMPQGGGGGRKLALSFALSAVIVLSLVVWTYTWVLHEETAPREAENALEVDVEGYQFGWDFEYPNGATTSTLYVPEDRMIILNVTSRDVFHNFGIPAFRAKADAMPGRYIEDWFVADEPGTYEAQCYELCGAGHSYMSATVEVMPQDEFQEWYANTNGTNSNGANETGSNGNGSNAHSVGEAS